MENNSINNIYKYKELNIIPLVRYDNIKCNKSIIYNENINKSGVYRWVNSKNGKSYVGSSINLANRLKIYYSVNYLKATLLVDNSRIYRALLKYGYSNFYLEIL